MARQEIIEYLKNMTPQDFVAHHIFDRCPHVFSDRREFIGWKKQLSRNINVDAAAITLFGSAAVGISLSPHKGLKDFDGSSDIDVAVISPYHFTMAWRYLRQNGNMRYRITSAQRASWDRHESGLVYYGTIATDKLLSLMPFGAEWFSASTTASRHSAIADREVLFRIYNDYDSLRSYQIRSVKAAVPVALLQ